MSIRSGSSISQRGSDNFTPSDAAGMTPNGDGPLTPKHGDSTSNHPGNSDPNVPAAGDHHSSGSPRGHHSSGGGPPPGFGSIASLDKKKSQRVGTGNSSAKGNTGRIPRPPTGSRTPRLGSARGSDVGSTGSRTGSARKPRLDTGGSVRRRPVASAQQRAQQLLLPAIGNGGGSQHEEQPGSMAGTLTHHQQQSLVAQLDSERRRHEAAGRFLEAQECLDVMRALTAEQGKQVIAEAVKKNIASDAKQGLLDEHRKQVFTFTRLWEEALQEFEAKAERHISDITERQRREFEEFEELIRSELAGKKNPHYSKGVLRGRQELAQLVELKRYKEADAVQKQLEAAEQAEKQHFEEELSLKFASKTKQLKRKYMLELQTTRQKIAQERDNLLTQRRSNYETLIQRHMNAVSAFDQRARTGAARDQKALSRQLDAMVNCPSKTTLASLANN